MPVCPVCAAPLASVPQRDGLCHHCPACDGRALTLPQLRRMAGDRFAMRLLRLIRLGRRAGKRPCPFCAQPMLVLECPEPPLELDACKPCNLLWFDPPSYAALPAGAVNDTPGTLTDQATEIIALRRLKELKDREAAEDLAAREKTRLRHSLKTLWDNRREG